MRIIFFTVLFSTLTTTCFCQKTNVTWGDEYKLKKGSTGIEVIQADATGVYVKETHLVNRSYFAMGVAMGESASLTKLNKDLKEEYTNNFNKELKGKEYETFFFLRKKLFLLATDYNRKDKTLALFAAEINKSTGELAGDFTEITSWQKEEKSEDINFKAGYNADSSKMVLVSTIEGKEKNTYQIQEFNDAMQPVSKPVIISNEFDAKTFVLEDVLYTLNGNVILVGKEYEYEEGKKKKAKYLDFKNYNIRIYNDVGKQVKQINTAINGKWLISTKIVQLHVSEFILAAFYSNEKRGLVNGMLLQRINPQTGEVVATSQQEMNTSIVSPVENGNSDDGTDEESKQEKAEREKLAKAQNDNDGFSKFLRFRNFIYTADNGLIILAEKYYTFTHTAQIYISGKWSTTTYLVYDCSDIIMSKIDAAGAISWLHVLPKLQRESVDIGSGTIPMNVDYYFLPKGDRPFYAGFGVLENDNTVNIIFNDQKANAGTLQPGQKVKPINAYANSDCYAVSLNTVTGKYTRKSLFSNSDVPTAMPRLSAVLGKDLYIVGKQDRLFGKTKIAVAKLSIK